MPPLQTSCPLWLPQRLPAVAQGVSPLPSPGWCMHQPGGAARPLQIIHSPDPEDYGLLYHATTRDTLLNVLMNNLAQATGLVWSACCWIGPCTAHLPSDNATTWTDDVDFIWYWGNHPPEWPMYADNLSFSTPHPRTMIQHPELKSNCWHVLQQCLLHRHRA